jgi:tRNA(Ile)-lysidine synthase
MQNKFFHAMEFSGISKTDKPILVAVSGGMDSMVLATLFHENGYQIGVAHCNYQLRGLESDGDKELVRNWCTEHEIPYHLKNVETQKLANETNRSVQMIARDERYAFFDALRKEYGYAFTALAHHANDRVESLLINILRGTGFRGLQGMPSKREGIIRPLIGFTKKELRDYAEETSVPFRNDASNLETYYQRNWVRLRLIPMLQHVDAKVFDQLLKLCERAEAEIPNYEECVTENLEDWKLEKNILSIHKIQQSKSPFTILKEFLRTKGFSSDQIFEVLAILDSVSVSQVCSGTHRVTKDRDCLIVSEIEVSEIKPNLSYELIPRSELKTLKTAINTALIDANTVGSHGASVTNTSMSTDSQKPDLQLRKWQKGDRFRPLGMKGWKKLSDFFIDEKLSILEKEQVWLMTYQDEIAWIVGKRLDDRFKVSESTQKVLKVTADS